MLPILVMVILMPMAFMDMLLMCLLDPALVLTPSPRELFLIMVLAMGVTTMERDLLMPSLRLTLLIWVMDILMPSELTDMLPMFHLDPALVLTQSPRELFLTMVLDMVVTTMERGPLKPNLRPMLPIWVTDILMPLVDMDMLPTFLLDPALVLTQSPKVLTPLLRELFLTMVLDMGVTTMASEE